MAKTLIIETSDKDAFLQIGEVHVSLPSKGQVCSLIPEIKKHADPKEIEKIYIGIGPGLYMGTRIGVMTAKALGYALNLNPYYFCSLMRFRPKLEGRFCAVASAKSKGLYVLEGTLSESGDIRYDASPYLKKTTIEELSLDFSEILHLGKDEADVSHITSLDIHAQVKDSPVLYLSTP